MSYGNSEQPPFPIEPTGNTVLLWTLCRSPFADFYCGRRNARTGRAAGCRRISARRWRLFRGGANFPDPPLGGAWKPLSLPIGRGWPRSCTTMNRCATVCRFALRVLSSSERPLRPRTAPTMRLGTNLLVESTLGCVPRCGAEGNCYSTHNCYSKSGYATHVCNGADDNPARDPVKEFARARDLGFGFVDLTLEPPAARADQVDAGRLRRALEMYGLGVVGHTAYYLPLCVRIRLHSSGRRWRG
jgi:hypothetical protein